VSLYAVPVVLEACVLTAVMVVGLTLFTFQTRYDFTVFAGSLVAALWMMLGLGLVLVRQRRLRLRYAAEAFRFACS
jgi:FtsH-binding integral membrane protein